MKNNSDFNRRRPGSSKQSSRMYTPPRKPIQKDEILGKKPFDKFPGLYQLSKGTNILEPKSIPKNKGSFVVIEKGPCPKSMEQNIICDDLEYFGEVGYKVWVPYYKFYIGQFVSFWTKHVEYVFQIFPSDDSRLGEFRLMDKRAVVRQPGSEFRTSRTKSI